MYLCSFFSIDFARWKMCSSLNKEKIINMFSATLNFLQVATWRLLLKRIKIVNLGTKKTKQFLKKNVFFLFEQKTIAQGLCTYTIWDTVVSTCSREVSNNRGVFRIQWNIKDGEFCENSFIWNNLHLRCFSGFCSILDVRLGSGYVPE